MNQQAYDTGYEMVYGLLDMVWQNWEFIAPVVLVPVVLGFVLWVWRGGRRALGDSEGDS